MSEEELNISRRRKRARKERQLGVLMVAGDPVAVKLEASPEVDGEEVEGYYCSVDSTIVLCTKLAPYAEREVLFHELIHCIADKYSMSLSNKNLSFYEFHVFGINSIYDHFYNSCII